MYAVQRKMELARIHYEQALKIARERHLEPHMIAVRLCNLSEVYRSLADFTRARACTTEALEIYRTVDPWDTSRHLPFMGVVWSELCAISIAEGQYRDASYYSDLSTAIARAERRDIRRLGNRLIWRGRIEMARREWERALRRLEEALANFRIVGDASGLGRANLYIAQVWHHRGEGEIAHQHYREAAEIRHPASFFAITARWGILHLHDGNASDAESLLQDCVEECNRLLAETATDYELLYTLALARLALAHVSQSPERCAAAVASYGDALAVCRATGVVDAVIQDLSLLEATGETSLVRQICGLLEHVDRASPENSAMSQFSARHDDEQS